MEMASFSLQDFMVRDQSIPVRVSQNPFERSPLKQSVPQNMNQGMLRNLSTSNNWNENMVYQ